MSKLTSLLISVLLFGTMAVFGEPELSGTSSELAEYLDDIPRTIVLNSKNELKVNADKAVVKLKLITESEKMSEAMNKMKNLRMMIKEKLLAAGILNKNVASSKFSSVPQVRWLSGKTKKHIVSNQYTIDINKQQHFDIIANLVDASEEIKFDNIKFMHTKDDSLRQEAISLAIKKLNKKELYFENELGLSLEMCDFSNSVMDLKEYQESVRRKFKIEYKMAFSKRINREEPVTEVKIDFDQLTYIAQMSAEYNINFNNK